MCPSPMKATSNGVFQGDSPLDYALPLAILQICLVVVVTRVLAFLMKPLRQPRVIAEIIVSFSSYHASFCFCSAPYILFFYWFPLYVTLVYDLLYYWFHFYYFS